MTANRNLIYLFFILTVSLFEKGYAQTKSIAYQENKLINLYAKLLKSSDSGNTDSTEYYSSKFGNEFKRFIKSNPPTIDYPFKRLIDSNYCYIKTSDDGNFRVYSWDTQTGGTMHYFNRIYQYKANGKTYAIIPENVVGNPGSFCSKIYAVTIKNKAYYLPIFNGIYSSKDVSQSVSVFTIDGTKLIDTVKLFKTKTKRLNNINIEFDFFSVVDRPERPLELITYDDKRKILYIPVVNDKGQVTNRSILYQLKNDSFEFISIEKGKL